MPLSSPYCGYEHHHPGTLRCLLERAATIPSDLSGRDKQVDWSPLAAADGVQFGVHATLGATDQTTAHPFLDGHTARCSVGLQVGGVDHHGRLIAPVLSPDVECLA